MTEHWNVIPVEHLPGIWQHRWCIKPGRTYDLLSPDPWGHSLWTNNGAQLDFPNGMWIHLITYDIPTALITDLRLAVHRPKVMIRPPLDPNMKVEDYKLLDEAIEIGYESATKALDEAWPEIAEGP